MNGLLRAVTGYYTVTFESQRPERILDYCLKMNIPVWKIRRTSPKAIRFSVSMRRFSAVKIFLEEKSYGDEAYSCSCHGLPDFAIRYRRRWGFYAGILLFSLVLYASTLFLWDIEVTGNARHTDAEVIEALAAQGVREGMRLRNFVKADEEIEFEIKNRDYSYISINIVGTRARVEVRETEPVGEKLSYEGSANLVAKVSGEIARYEVLSGQIAVKKGDLIEKGKLLVSGVVENKNGSFRTVRAAGRVFANTERYFEESIGLEQTEKAYTGKEKERRTYSLLGFDFRLPWGSDSSFDSFDTVLEEEKITLGNIRLPITRKREIFLETEEKPERINVDRARDLAYDRYEDYKRENLAADTEILEESIDFRENGEEITIVCQLKLCEDIAQEKSFTYYPTEKTDEKE